MKDKLLGKELAGGRFRIIGDNPLGKGGFATVYLGIQTQLKRKVAIKVLSESASDDRDLVKRFIREAKVVAMFEHPNIIKIIDSGSEDDVHYFVMNYLPTSLQLILRRPENQHGLPLDQWVKIAKDMASALNYMHNHKTIKEFIHRDIKPGNIMFDESGNAILTDFGLVKSEQFSQLTLRDSVMGTPKYMSPEQVRGDELDHRADIYSLGIVLYEMLVGQPPFVGDPLSICHKQVAVPPPSPHTLKQGVPEELEAIVIKCIEKDIDKRYQSAAELLADLEEWENFTRKSHRSATTIKSTGPKDLSKTTLTADKMIQPAGHAPTPSDSVTPQKTNMSEKTDPVQQSRATPKRDSIDKDARKSSTQLRWIALTMAVLLVIFLYILFSSRPSQITRGALFINSTPPGATVTIDGQPGPGKTPLVLTDYALKTYQLRIDLEGYESWSDSVSLNTQDTLKISATLLALSSDTTSSEKELKRQKIEEKPIIIAKPAFGSLAIQSNPVGAEIYLDNIIQSKVTNCVIEQLKSKTYRVKLILKGYQPWETEVYVQAGKEISILTNLSPIPIVAEKTTGIVSISIVNEAEEPSWGTVIVDGEPFKDKNGEIVQSSGEIELPIGAHRITVSRFEYEAKEGVREIELKPDEPVYLRFTLIKK